MLFMLGELGVSYTYSFVGNKPVHDNDYIDRNQFLYCIFFINATCLYGFMTGSISDSGPECLRENIQIHYIIYMDTEQGNTDIDEELE